MIPNQCKSNFHYLMKRIKNLEEYSIYYGVVYCDVSETIE